MSRACAVALPLLLVGLWIASAVAQPDADAKAATATVMAQLDAFRHDDFDTAYTFASATIRELFDRQAFERMVRTGYPEIARSSIVVVGASEVGPNGNLYLSMRIRGTNGNTIQALYEMVRETAGWRINGVVARPDDGLV